MRQVYRFVYRGEHTARLLDLCDTCRCLYNQAVYAFRQQVGKGDGKWLFYKDLEKLMKTTPNKEGEINYRKLKAQCAQQCLREVDASIRSFAATIKDWKAHKEKYNGKPNLPGYNRGRRRTVIFTNQNSTIKSGRLHLYKDLWIPIPQWDVYRDGLARFQQARIVPKDDKSVLVELIYKRVVAESVGGKKIASVDLGVNNLATMVTSDGDAVIYNGRALKAINQLADKRLARCQSILEKENRVSKKHSRMTRMIQRKRNARMHDAMHKVSRAIVDYLAERGIGTLAVGYNADWKREASLGKRTNQAFAQMPFLKLLRMLEYKCGLAGIKFVEHEESYTSRCDALALEPVGKHETYLGKRKKRGLFQSSTGVLVNADVNGALNIMRKVFGDSPVRGIAD
ncbi:MAG: transposase, partial [Bacteroidales bacterium]|nr:transposase [Bacteroidales bacterium]